jgi:hypothetical protein
VNALLWIGGALAAAYVVSQSSSQANLDAAWPPSANVQQALVTQISQMFSASGTQLTSAQQTQLAGYVSSGIAEYAGTIPAGSLPTVAGFQAWMLSEATLAAAYVQAGGQGLNQGQYGQGGAQGQQGQGATGELSELGTLMGQGGTNGTQSVSGWNMGGEVPAWGYPGGY